MAFRIEFSDEAEKDFELIFNHLFESYVAFGEETDIAFEHAQKRILQIRKEPEKLCQNPFRGTLHNDMLPHLRNITLGRAIYWFDIDQENFKIKILAIFFGRQNHIRHMLIRLLQQKN